MADVSKQVSGDTWTYEQWSDAIDGLWAYDYGAVDSGIKDERLRERIKATLHTDQGFEWMTRFARELIAEGQPYTIEDVAKFVRWLSEMGFDL